VVGNYRPPTSIIVAEERRSEAASATRATWTPRSGWSTLVREFSQHRAYAIEWRIDRRVVSRGDVAARSRDS
jgi:hypothetical protein